MDGNAKRGENTDHKALNLCVRTFFHSRFNASQKFCFYYDAMDRFELSKPRILSSAKLQSSFSPVYLLTRRP